MKYLKPLNFMEIQIFMDILGIRLSPVLNQLQSKATANKQIPQSDVIGYLGPARLDLWLNPLGRS